MRNLFDWIFSKNYVCGICSKAFRFQFSLSNHLHTDHEGFEQAPDGTVLNWGRRQGEGETERSAFKKFIHSKAGKAQIICEASWMAATALAFYLRSGELATVLLPVGAVIVIVFMIHATRKVNKK